ncbi:MAG: hypothetical protein ACRETF_10845 [Nevskiaceae bacterium]
MSKQRVWQGMALMVVLSGCGFPNDQKDGKAEDASAASGGIVLEGRGTAQLDGVISAGEWDDAGRIEFDARVPLHDGGGTVPATLLAMHDDANLYLAVKLRRPAYGGATQPIFEFDNDNDGVLFEPGDDIVHMFVGEFTAPQFWDVYRYPCPGSEDPSFAGCSARDVDGGGSSDGAAAPGLDGTFTTIELSHPLDGADDAHDFSLAPGATVGFAFTLHWFSLDTACNFGNECSEDTNLMAAFRVAGGAPPPVALLIDVMPGSEVNPVNPSDRGVIPVAVLGSAQLDAAALDPGQACFGDAEDAAQRDCTEAHGRGHVEDVNADGYADLLLHFETRQTGIDAGDAQACLSIGAFEACDVIRTVPGP